VRTWSTAQVEVVLSKGSWRELWVVSRVLAAAISPDSRVVVAGVFGVVAVQRGFLSPLWECEREEVRVREAE